MAKCKITVLKRALNKELAEKYCSNGGEYCPVFVEGQEFICDGINMPEGFCGGAWHDIYHNVLSMLTGGNFAGDIYKGYMKYENKMVACCTDGIRPVSFEIEKLS